MSTTVAAQQKRRTKILLKNVLCQPFERSWPQITADEAAQLIRQLDTIRIQSDVPSEPTASIWRSPRHCTIGFKAALRQLQQPKNQQQQQPQPKPAPHKSTSVANVLLLSADIRPKFIVDQAVRLAATQRNPTVRCLLLPGMRQLIADTVGGDKSAATSSTKTPPSLTGCMCLLLKDVEDKTFVAFIASLLERYPVASKVQRQILKTKNEQHRSTAPKPKQDADNEPQESTLEDLYLMRPAAGQRAFIPPKTTGATDAASSTGSDANKWSEYITLSSSTSSSTPKPSQPPNFAAIQRMKNKMKIGGSKGGSGGGGYVTLSVNRVQANPNKAKNHHQQQQTKQNATKNNKQRR